MTPQSQYSTLLHICGLICSEATYSCQAHAQFLYNTSHIKLVSRDPFTPTDGLGGLGVPINFLPLLLVLVQVFL